MSNIFGRIFGTEKAINNILDKDNGLLMRVGGFVNDLHLSPEEKLKYNQNIREWSVKQLSALEPFKVVQRILVATTCSMWLLIILSLVLSTLFRQQEIVKNLLLLIQEPFVSFPPIAAFALYLTGGVFESARRPPEKL